MKNPGADGDQLPVASILQSKPYPGTHATIGQFIALADEYCVAAYSLLSQCNRMSPSSSAPARLCAIHAVEMYLNAFLIFHGMTPAAVRGLQHNLAERAGAATLNGLSLRSKTQAHLAARSFPVMRPYLSRPSCGTDPLDGSRAMGTSFRWVLAWLVWVTAAASHGSELNIVRCEPGMWQGGRVGFDLSEIPVIDTNSIRYDTYVIAWERGSQTAQVTYGSGSYQGQIIYDGGDGKIGYVIIVTQPKQIIEQLIVNAATGKVIITNTKRLAGLWQDSFVRQCDVLSGR